VRPRTRVRFPPPPLKPFEAGLDLRYGRRQIWRRLWRLRIRCSLQRTRKLVEGTSSVYCWVVSGREWPIGPCNATTSRPALGVPHVLVHFGACRPGLDLSIPEMSAHPPFADATNLIRSTEWQRKWANKLEAGIDPCLEALKYATGQPNIFLFLPTYEPLRHCALTTSSRGRGRGRWPGEAITHATFSPPTRRSAGGAGPPV